MARKEPQDFKAKLAKASLPERSMPLCLNGALQGEYDELAAELAGLPAGEQRLGRNPEAVRISKRMLEISEEMRDSEVVFRLRALPRKDWKSLWAQHPAKDDDTPGSKALGVSLEAFLEQLVRQSIVDPALDDEDLETTLDVLTDKQYSDLTDLAWSLNRGDVSIPFSALASEIQRNSGETQKPLPAGESALAASPAGSQKPAPATGTAAKAG